MQPLRFDPDIPNRFNSVIGLVTELVLSLHAHGSTRPTSPPAGTRAERGSARTPLTKSGLWDGAGTRGGGEGAWYVAPERQARRDVFEQLLNTY